MQSDSNVQTAQNSRPQGTWFGEAKFGMFIHWGPYAVLAGEYQGKRQYGSGEWIQRMQQIPVQDYETYAAQFNPVEFDAEEWVQTAVKTGMRYIVITAKHHDGFAMYHSQVDAYNIVDFTPFDRDPLKELAEACARHDVTLCFYYSQFQDWHEPGAGRDGTDSAFGEYFERKCLPQIRELLTNYGRIGAIWFDTPGRITHEQSLVLKDLVRELQPECLVSSRLGHDLGDYQVLGDSEIPDEPQEGLWEAIDTHNDSWGYISYEHNWKGPHHVIADLMQVLSKGGNYLLNVGPDATGRFPEPAVAILGEVGIWVARHSQAIYSSSASLLGHVPWGYCTSQSGKLYLHVFDWPRDSVLRLPGFQGRASRAYPLLSPDSTCRITEKPHGLEIAISRFPADAPATTIVLEHAEEGTSDTQLALLPGHTNTWPVTWAERHGNTELSKFTWDVKKGSWHHANCAHEWTSPSDQVVWQFAVYDAGQYFVDLTYSADSEAGNREGWFQIDETAKSPFIAYSTGEGGHTGGLSAAPRLRFETIRVGFITIDQPGDHRLTIHPDGDGKTWIKLRSVTLAPVL